MDIDLLSKMIAEIIPENDEVALPGVGTFVAEFVPSTFSDKGYTINPPYRKLSFRQREGSDRKLVELYASSNGLDMDTASSIIIEFLSELRSTLISRKTIVFPGLGRLRATKENNFFFVPDLDLNIYPEGFGLEPVSLKTHVETEDDVEAAVASLHSIISPDSGSVPEPAEEESPAEEARPAILETASIPACENARPKKKRKFVALKILLGILAFAAILFCIFVLLAHIAPDFIDKILYSPEELEIVRQI